MNCPKCKSFMEQLVTVSEELMSDANDETIRKTMTEVYQRCKNEACGHSETTGVEIQEEKLPFQVMH